MSKYRSKLDAVLRERERKEEEVKLQLLEMQDLLAEGENRLSRLRRAMEAVLRDLGERQKEGMVSTELDLYHQFIKQQSEKWEEERTTVEDLTHRCEKKREEVLEASREKKMVEKIESSRKEAYLKETKKKERDLFDDLAGRMKKGPPVA
ncbi:MAG: flagellar export protein FliJ [Candidatus Manganitrophaceae bacterium]